MTAVRSPFPPIAGYALLPACPPGPLVPPAGSVDWLCVPSFDSPSVFGSLLDRGAGNFRFGPYGIHHPVSRHYEPGSQGLKPTGRAPTGWLVVRDALTIYPRHDPDLATPHTRPPV